MLLDCVLWALLEEKEKETWSWIYLENTWGGGLWGSQQHKRDLKHMPCHKKFLLFSSLCPTNMHLLSVDTCSCYSLIKLFFFFFFTVLYLSFVFLPASKVNRQMSPKTSVQVPSSLISNNLTSLSSSLALLWRLPLVSPLWKRCQNAEWVFLSGELEPVSEQQCGSSCSLGARFAIIGNYEGFIIVLQLHCLLHLVRWLLDGTVFQLGCPLFVCQASKTT